MTDSKLQIETKLELNNEIKLDPYKCIAKTGKGTQCKNRKEAGLDFCGVHSKKIKAESPEFKRCEKMTKKGERCIHEAEENKTLCKRHRVIEERGGRPRYTITRLNNQTEEEKKRIDFFNQVFMSLGIMDGNYEDYEFKLDAGDEEFKNSNNSNNNITLSTTLISHNIKTHGERECSICYCNKQMVIMFCCRQEMCSDCMKKITNSKCPFCKQNNLMTTI